MWGTFLLLLFIGVSAGAELWRLSKYLATYSQRKSRGTVSHMEVDVLAVVERTLVSESHLGFLLLILCVILGKATSLDLNCLFCNIGRLSQVVHTQSPL